MRSQLLLAIGYSILLTWSQSAEACGPGRAGGRRQMLRKYPPLVQRQYIPNVSENTLGASGRPEGPIKRKDKRFKELVQNWNPDIEFRDDEQTGADRMMSQRLKEKLSTLAISVMNQWPNVKLRVIEGWDEDNRHSLNSLHYEGRAVDITTSDRDKSKYGMLARLAVEAGFDWVHYESRSHVHCSVKSEKADAIRNNGCFDARTLVETPAGQVEMSQLQTNDLVLTMNSRTGKLKFSPIIMWLDRDEQGEELYVELKTKSNRLIRLTSSHLIYAADEPVDLTKLAAAAATTTTKLYPAKQTPSAASSSSLAESGNGNNNQYFYYDTLATSQTPEQQTNSSLVDSDRNTNNQTNVPIRGGRQSPSEPNEANEIFQFKPTSELTLDDVSFTTYARNLVVGQYLLIKPPIDESVASKSEEENNKVIEEVEEDKERGQEHSRLTHELQVLEKELANTPLSRIVFRHRDRSHPKDDYVQKANLKQTKPPQPTVTFDQIVSVNYVTRKGIYAPLTREGNIVANSVVASCYAVINDHEMAHISFAPVRWFSYLFEWLVGLRPETPLSERTIEVISRRQDVNSTATNSTQQVDDSQITPRTLSSPSTTADNAERLSRREIHWYPTMLYCIARFILPTSYLY